MKATICIIFMMGVRVNPDIVSADNCTAIRLQELKRDGNLPVMSREALVLQGLCPIQEALT
jgi:hypothetical protein